uniref:Uncharacterized protein n=1 Tax=Rhizophora mucronata TaxID=61149 RepID=A0A2P2PCM1_RHIMU
MIVVNLLRCDEHCVCLCCSKGLRWIYHCWDFFLVDLSTHV